MPIYRVPPPFRGLNASPLSYGLIGAWRADNQDKLRDYIGSRDMVRGTTSTDTTLGRYGRGANTITADGGTTTNAPHYAGSVVAGLNDFTMFALAEIASSGNPGAIIADRPSAGGNPSYSLLSSASNNARLLCRNAAGGTLLDVTGGSFGSAPWSPGPYGGQGGDSDAHAWGMSIHLDGAANAGTIYFDGKSYVTQTNANALGTLTGSTNFFAGILPGNGSNIQRTYVTYAWNRVLSAAEHLYVAANPFWYWSLEDEFFAPSGIQFDAASNSGYQTAQSTYTWNHTCTGSNRHLLVGISMLSVAGSSVSGITYNGVAMTFLGAKASVSGAIRVELWGLVAPATGTNAIAVTLSASLDSVGGAISTTGVHQTSPTEAFNSASATNVGAADATVDVTTVADNDWVLDAVATSDTTITVTGTQTQRSNVSGALGSGATGSQGPKTPPGTVTSAWTNVGALATWSIAAIALRPIAASNLGSQTPWYLFERMVA